MKIYLTEFNIFHICANHRYVAVYIQEDDYYVCSSKICRVRVPSLLTIGYEIKRDPFGSDKHRVLGSAAYLTSLDEQAFHYLNNESYCVEIDI